MNKSNIFYEVYVGDLNTITGNIINADGTAKDISDTTTYNTSKLHVWQPNGVLVINGAGGYGTRSLGQVNYTLQTADTVDANSGNWTGRFITFDNNGNESDTSQIFNFNIIRVF